MKKIFPLAIVFLSITHNIFAQKFEESSWVYEVSSSIDLTVKLVGRASSLWPTTTEIPSEVIHNGITFTVTAIGRFATHWYSNSNSPNNGYYNYSYNRGNNMTNLNIPITITNIEDSAFLGCSNLSHVTFNSTTPPILGTDVFNGLPLYAFLYVPCGSIPAYSSNVCLSQFTHFLEEGSYGSFDVQSNDITMGTVNILQTPTCTQPAIVEATPVLANGWMDVYEFSSWSDGDTNNPRSITITCDSSITAIFSRKILTMPIQSADTSKGYCYSDSAMYGDSVVITAVPYYGYQFSNWGRTNPYVYSIENPLTVLCDGKNSIYKCYFTKTLFNVSVNSNGGGTASFSGHPDSTQGACLYQSTVYLEAIPFDGNRFVMWSDSNEFPFRSLYVSGDTSIMAIFAPIASLRDTIYDTIYVHDTTTVYHTDTLWLHDTITIHDTIYITQEGIDGMDALDAKIYSNSGQIVMEGAEQNTVTLFDINGRLLATKQDYGSPLRFDVPANGTYMVKIGHHAARKIVVIR